MDALSSPRMKSEYRAPLSHALDLISASQKFILPDGGKIIDDPEFRALDDEITEISLPYKFIALEYFVSSPNLAHGLTKCSRRIALCRELDEYIAMMPLFCTDNDGMWRVMPEIGIPRRGFFDRSTVGERGVPAVAYQMSDSRIPFSDYNDEVMALLSTINALRCANVHVERSDPKKRTGKTSKNPLPFDSYHILTVDPYRNRLPVGGFGSGSHRSPREHLRRGHIRRYENGARIWVNATVVNPGKGGVVSKDYAIAGRRGNASQDHPWHAAA